MAPMSVIELSRPDGPARHRAPDIDIVVPVYNEAAQIESSVRALHDFVHDGFPLTARITIADNASTDGTWEKAAALANSLSGVRAIHLDEKGRGRALRAAWSASDAAVVAYLDVAAGGRTKQPPCVSEDSIFNLLDAKEIGRAHV